MSIVTAVALALGPLRDEFVLVGGCCVGLLITDPGRPPVRQTIDVDLVAEVASLSAYYDNLRPGLMARGFRQSPEDEHMCRWRQGPLVLDVMPSSPSIFGHSTNRWYAEAIASARETPLEGGLRMRVVTAPVFVATKFEAFAGRGEGDYLHQDMEDIVNLVAGRPELADEVGTASEAVQQYLRECFEDLLDDPQFLDKIEWLFASEPAPARRIEIVIARMRRLAGF